METGKAVMYVKRDSTGKAISVEIVRIVAVFAATALVQSIDSPETPEFSVMRSFLVI